MFDLLWEIYQQRQIDDLKRAGHQSESAIQSARDVTERVRLLEERLDRVALVTHAMWSLVSEKTGLTEADLAKRATDLDGRDGAIDGRVTRPSVRCAKCGAAVSNKFQRCLFCGEEHPSRATLDAL